MHYLSGIIVENKEQAKFETWNCVTVILRSNLLRCDRATREEGHRFSSLPLCLHLCLTRCLSLFSSTTPSVQLLKPNKSWKELRERGSVFLRGPSQGWRILLLVYGGFLFQEGQTQMTTPTSFRRYRHRGREAVHVVTSITVITEQQLIIIF